MTKTVLEVRDLVKTFTVDGLPIHAVDHVNFQVHAGEFVGLVGPSGSGKTTLLAVLAALLTPTSGEVLIDGRALSTMGEKERVRLRRSRIGFTFQSNNLIPFLNAQENVDIMLRLNGYERNGGRNGTVELLSRLGLGDHLHFLPGQMSGGQQQRVAIAVAMANQPDLLLADEPTGELDSITAQQILELLQQMNERYGLTTIIVTHDPHIARAVNRVVTIRDGRISSETIRREDDVASALTAGITATHAQHVFEEYLVVDEGGHLQLPHDLTERAGIGDRVTLELKEDGLLIKPVAGRSSVATPLLAVPEEEPPAKRKAWWKRSKKD